MSLATHTSPLARKRLRKRYAAETRFRVAGFTALLVAFGFLAFFIVNITRQAIPAFFQHYFVVVPEISKTGLAANAPAQDIKTASYDGAVRETLQRLFPDVTDKKDKRFLSGLLSSGAPLILRNAVIKTPQILSTPTRVSLPFSDAADLFLKDKNAMRAVPSQGNLTLMRDGATAVLTSSDDKVFDAAAQVLQQGGSALVKAGGGYIKLKVSQGATASGDVLLPSASDGVFASSNWSLQLIGQPEQQRKLKDNAIAYLDSLQDRGFIEQHISREFFTLGASRESEMAGVFAALMGSILTLVVTLVASFPVSVAAAVYLEQFAPKNRFTDLIEVNINNLAAVPSIIFGLLGLAVFLNMFGMPRSAPIVGGLVLALMTMPVIIIASRAALRAVPPSVKEAALGLGASHMQAVFHHVLPLAVPGILTGTILGTARALGETAPLLLIGMVAFVVDPPKGLGDAATLLPVQIFMWNDFPEIGFQQKTAAAILVLLVFLGLMNLVAVVLRRRFERRW